MHLRGLPDDTYPCVWVGTTGTESWYGNGECHTRGDGLGARSDDARGGVGGGGGGAEDMGGAGRMKSASRVVKIVEVLDHLRSPHTHPEYPYPPTWHTQSPRPHVTHWRLDSSIPNRPQCCPSAIPSRTSQIPTTVTFTRPAADSLLLLSRSFFHTFRFKVHAVGYQGPRKSDYGPLSWESQTMKSCLF